jgi:large subunit ribosomal protein L18
MDQQKAKKIRQLRRRRHVRRKMAGTAERPRLSVHRSSKHIYAQLIDDVTGVTLAAASSLMPDLQSELKYGGNKKAAAVVGKKLAEKAKEKGIQMAAFDRGHYRYHGRVKALAEAANAAGLKCCQPKHPPKVEEAPKAKATAPSEGKKEKPKKAEKAEKTEKPAKAEKQQPAE